MVDRVISPVAFEDHCICTVSATYDFVITGAITFRDIDGIITGSGIDHISTFSASNDIIT